MMLNGNTMFPVQEELINKFWISKLLGKDKYSISQSRYHCFFKLAIPGLFLLYFRLFNTVDSKQMFDKSLPMTGFEQQISGVGGDRSTNWATTITAPNIFTSFFACKTDFKTDVHRRPSYWKNFFTFNLRSTGVNAISKFMRRIAMLPRNRALWLAIPTTMTFSNQSEGFISA